MLPADEVIPAALRLVEEQERFQILNLVANAIA